MYEKGVMVVASYQGNNYLGKVIDHDEADGELQITFMEQQHTKAGLTFKWPYREDVLWMSPDAILKEIQELKPVGKSKRAFVVSKDDQYLFH